MDVDLFAEARQALEALELVDLAACDRDGLDEVLARWRTVRSFADAYEVRIARRARQLAAEGRGETAAGVLGLGGRRSRREAGAAAEREQACGELPGFERALGAGAVSAGHLDALASALHGLDGHAREAFTSHAEALLRQAERESVEAFARECSELARLVAGDEGESRLERQRRQCRLRQWVDRVTGMYHIHAELDPESGAKAWTAINAVTTAMRHDHERRTASASPATNATAADATPDTTASGTATPGPDSGTSPTTTTDPESGTATTDPASGTMPPTTTDPESGTGSGTGSGPGTDRDSGAAARAGRPEHAPSWDWYAARALVELLTGARSVDRRVPEVAVLIDWQTLRNGLHEHSLCETADGTLLPPSTVRRLCCQAEILPQVLDGAGEILDQGRSQRLANREQRRALRAMYRTCGHPDCSVSFERCEIHHVDWLEHFGPTDLDNLLPLCSHHHHLVHEGRWTLRLAPHRIITLTRPEGTIHYSGSTVDRPIPAARAGAPPRRRRTAA